MCLQGLTAGSPEANPGCEAVSRIKEFFARTREDRTIARDPHETVRKSCPFTLNRGRVRTSVTMSGPALLRILAEQLVALLARCQLKPTSPTRPDQTWS